MEANCEFRSFIEFGPNVITFTIHVPILSSQWALALLSAAPIEQKKKKEK